MPKGRRRRRLVRWMWALVDGAVWLTAVIAASWMRFDFSIPDEFLASTAMFALVAALLHLVVGAVIGPYAVGHQRGSYEEAADVARTVAITTLPLLVWALAAQPIVVPRSTPLIAGALALVGMFAIRFLVRAWRSRRGVPGADEKQVIVFGAGEAGRRLVRLMLRDPHSGYYPVALLDDDLSLRRLRIDGVKVSGTRQDIGSVADRTEP